MYIDDNKLNSQLAGLPGAYGFNIITDRSTIRRIDNKNINAYHVNSTTPYLYRYPGGVYEIMDFELLVSILSALTWRMYNGSITMITDIEGYEFYKTNNLMSIWNQILPTLDCRLEGISPQIYWAAGKILALRDIPQPSVIIDTDFIVWESIGNILTADALVCAHTEPLYDDVYPDKEFFDTKPGYAFDLLWNFKALPLNTCFLYMPEPSFKDYYVKKSIEFMNNSRSLHDNKVWSMVFAEQRILAMCAEAKKINVKTLMDLDRLDKSQERYTHVWNAKRYITGNTAVRKYFCRCCTSKIESFFPQYIDTLQSIPCLSEYFI